MSFFNKESYSISDIQELINSHTEESLYYEFKAAGSLQHIPAVKQEIIKDVSAMANSAGGVIIYGLNENNHVAQSISYVDGNTFTKEHLEQIINSNIFRRIEGLRIFPVRNNNLISETIYVVQIPESKSGPHMTSDKKFYRRHNFQVLQMEEYEIRSAYNQREKTDLEIADLTYTGGGRGGDFPQIRFIDFGVQFHVKNIGASIAELFKLEIRMHIIPYLSAPENRIRFSKFPTREGDNFITVSVPNTSPLFQEEQNSIFDFNLRITNHSKPYLIQHPIKVKLYYSTGTKEREFNLADIILFAGHPIRDIQFIQ